MSSGNWKKIEGNWENGWQVFENSNKPGLDPLKYAMIHLKTAWWDTTRTSEQMKEIL